MADKKKGPPVPHQRRGVATPKTNLYARQQEVLKKENRFTIECFRQRAANSTNPVFRASQLGIPLTSTLSAAALAQATRPASDDLAAGMENLVDGNTGVLLSRGSLPSGILANYSKIPSMAEWRVAEKKHRDLKMELEALDKEIAEKDRALREKMHESVAQGLLSSTSPSTAEATDVVQKAARASCLAPAFTWEMNRTQSTTRTDFSWHRNEYPALYQVSQTQYGDMSRSCDYFPLKTKAVRKTKPGSRR